MNVRRATPDDAPAIHVVHVASIRGVCASAYSPDQIEAWTSLLSVDRYLHGMSLSSFLVAEETAAILGFSVLNEPASELHALYVAPTATRRGVGSALLSAAEDLAITSRIRNLTLKATLNAVAFYQHAGYHPVADVSHILPTGHALSCVQMLKCLPPPAGAA